MSTVTEDKVTMLARILEGDVEKFLNSVGVTEKFDQGYAKECVFLNLLANSIIYRSVLDKDEGRIPPGAMMTDMEMRLQHIIEELERTVNFHIDKHVAAAQAKK
jgi:hypothetical protein